MTTSTLLMPVRDASINVRRKRDYRIHYVVDYWVRAAVMLHTRIIDITFLIPLLDDA